MRTVLLLLLAEAARWKNKRNIAFLIVLIIGMISTICYVREQKNEEQKTGKIVLGVAKEDTSAYADLLMEYFNANEDFLKYVELIEGSERELKCAIEEQRLDAYLTIPKNFAQSMIDMENLPIRACVSMKNPTKALVLRNVMEAYEIYIETVEANCTALYRRMKEEGFSSELLEEANVEISMDLIFTALGKDDLFRKQQVEQSAKESENGLSLADHYRYSGVYFVLLFLFLPAGLRVLDLKQNNMLLRMKAVHIPVISAMSAIALPYMLFTGVSLAVICLKQAGISVLPKALMLSLPWLVLFLIFGLKCKNKEQYLFLCSVILVCLAVFGGSLIPERFLPDSFCTVAKWMPNRNFTFIMGGVQP